MFSVCCISSAPVRLQNRSLRLARPAPRKACDFEGLYAPSDADPVAEGSPTLFHRVAELREEHQARLRVAAEAGKAVASALPSRRRDRGCCSGPTIESSTSMNPSIPRLVGALSNRHSLNFSFEEAARVESLCNGILVFLGPSALAKRVGI